MKKLLLPICLLPGISFAQSANVPAFLQDEAMRSQYQQQLIQQQQFQQQNPNASIPEFVQKEQEEQQQYQLQLLQLQQQQNQYNYQSADPNAAPVVAAPPMMHEPAPGDTPAFLTQPQNHEPQEEAQTLKTNKKEDIIQINFSDDQYKAEEEVTTLNKDQATQYNTEVKNTEENPAHAEIPEGAKFEGEAKAEVPAGAATATAVPAEAEKEKQIENTAVPEPHKSQTNIMRITYSQEVTELSEKDKASLLAVVRLLKTNKAQKILITANTSERDLGVSADKIALMRVIGIRDFLMKQRVDFSQTEVKVKSANKNKEDLDYIDIDKI